MTDIFVGEYGRTLYVDVGYDISSATGTEIHFSSSAQSLVNSASVSIVATNTTASACGTTFSAGKHVEYIINQADFASAGLAGKYRVWVEASWSNARLISSSFKFDVTVPGSD